MNVLVTGGAGYIGSHACDALLKAGHSVVLYDNLSRGHEEAVRILARRGGARLRFVQGELSDGVRLGEAFTGGVDAVMHFAAHANVGESSADPVLYYRNNVASMIPLLEAIAARNIRRIVYSSSCSVYGQPADHLIPLREDAPLGPISPYGRTKLIGEQMLQDVAAALSARDAAPAMTSLRYFNVAGCEPAGELGEDHDPELHLIPVVLRTALGLQPSLKLFGEDYYLSAFGAGRHQMTFATASALMGGNVRVGLEDNLFLGRGELAKNNAEQVAKVRAVLVGLGHEIATPDDARAMLALKGRAATKF